jgi:hypothetical protein
MDQLRSGLAQQAGLGVDDASCLQNRGVIEIGGC